MEDCLRGRLLAVFAGLVLAGIAHGATVQPATPVDRPPPDYPDQAGTAEGYVKLHFTIGKDGHVKDAVVFESNPQATFDVAAVAAMSHWTYQPRLVDGHPVDQPDNAIMLRFKPSPPPEIVWLNPEPPAYPREAYDKKIEGSVKVAFDVSPVGLATNVRVLEGSPPNVFDKAALRDVEDRIFQPPVANGQRQGVSGVTATIEFRLKDAHVASKPIHIVRPEYPAKADDQRMIGYVAVDFTIEPDGSVSDPKIVQSFPDGVFDKSTLAVFPRWKFEPPVEPVSNKGHYLFRYLQRGVPDSAYHYMKAGQWVQLAYTLTTDGRPKDIRLVDKSDADVDVPKAVGQLRKMAFAPIVENGVAIEKADQFIKINGSD
jgi:TonB family protein